MFLRVSFFPEWVKLFRRTFKRLTSNRSKDNRSSSSSSRQADFRIHLHVPSKDWIDLKVDSKKPYHLKSHQLPGRHQSVEIHPLPHSRTESRAALLSDPGRPGSARPGSSRPDTAQSNNLGQKDRSKKVNVDDILAMRRLESGSRQGIREYPGVQPTKITRFLGEDESAWPTYQFGK
jgi:hypothetical protein